MQEALRLNKKLLQVLHSPPRRVFCCTFSNQHPQEHPQSPSHCELPRRQQESVFSEYSHGDIYRKSNLAPTDYGHAKPGIGQASSNPGDGELNLLDLNGAQQEQIGNPYPSYGGHSARKILDGLDRLGDQVDPSTYSSLLQLYSSSRSLFNGKLVHDHIISHGLQHDGRLGALILEMYCKCDALEDALLLFANMQRPCDAPTWNIIMRTLNEQGEGERALQLYERMHLEGVLPDKVTYILLMSFSAALAMPYKGASVHACNVCGDFASDIVLETAILNMYAKCGRLADAKRLFDRMLNKNVITWTTYITAHTQHRKQVETLQLFCQMHQEGQVPNRVTYVNTICACAGLKDLANGRRIHVLMLSNEVDRDIVVMTALANMYGNCGSAKDALEVFHESIEWNVGPWNAVIAALVNCGQEKVAWSQFLQMQQHGILPDRVTFLSAVDFCSSLVFEKQSDWLYACILGTKFSSDTMLNNALISMYTKFGKLCIAREVFEEMPDKNVISWNTIITAYAQRKQGKVSCQLFYQMQHEGMLADKVSFYGYFDACGAQKDLGEGARMHACLLRSDATVLDAFLVTALITMYGRCGSLKHVQDTFDEFSEHNIITWNALLAAYAQHDERRALLLFDQLLWEGMAPTEATFVGLLNAYKNPDFLADGERIHTVLLNSGYATDVIVANALMNMYSKCGNLTSSQIVFDNMPERDPVSWSTIIGVYGEHGQGKKALDLFEEMLKHTVPDEVTFLNVFTACNRSGLLEDGNRWFKSMSREYGIRPNGDHYSCMIDLFGRAGRLGEAENLMEHMPFEPSYNAWVAFLGACRYTNDVKRAELSAQSLFENHPRNHQPLVLLANIYAAAGRREDAARMRSMIMTLG